MTHALCGLRYRPLCGEAIDIIIEYDSGFLSRDFLDDSGIVHGGARDHGRRTQQEQDYLVQDPDKP